jgi:hypothetical protein
MLLYRKGDADGNSNMSQLSGEWHVNWTDRSECILKDLQEEMKECTTDAEHNQKPVKSVRSNGKCSGSNLRI